MDSELGNVRGEGQVSVNGKVLPGDKGKASISAGLLRNEHFGYRERYVSTECKD